MGGGSAPVAAGARRTTAKRCMHQQRSWTAATRSSRTPQRLWPPSCCSTPTSAIGNPRTRRNAVRTAGQEAKRTLWRSLSWRCNACPNSRVKASCDATPAAQWRTPPRACTTASPTSSCGTAPGTRSTTRRLQHSTTSASRSEARRRPPKPPRRFRQPARRGARRCPVPQVCGAVRRGWGLCRNRHPRWRAGRDGALANLVCGVLQEPFAPRLDGPVAGGGRRLRWRWNATPRAVGPPAPLRSGFDPLRPNLCNFGPRPTEIVQIGPNRSKSGRSGRTH